MPTNNFIEALSTPQENGIVIFVSGFLFMMSLYHFLLYFQHKDRAYLYYAFYAFLVFIYTYHRANHFILTNISKPIIPAIEFLYDPIKWLYSTVYLMFAISFVDLDKYNPKWYKYLVNFSILSLIVLSITTLFSFVFRNNIITDYAYNFFFLPILFLLSIYVLYIIYKTSSPVKYYLLIGGGFYLVVTTFSHYLTYTGTPFRVLFYMATIFELILFALGLGQKQKLVLIEKNRWQALIIKEHEENIKLKDALTKKMNDLLSKNSEEISALLAENESEKRKKMALTYSKQILQLRMQAVQAQMNPHFLFNSLNSLKIFIIKNKQKEAVFYLTKFAKYLRMVLDYSKLKEISLSDEIALMKLYLQVENLRFNDDVIFDVHIGNDIDLNAIKVPPLIFQAYIENAIWHGLALKKGKKIITLKVDKEFPYTRIEITDNGIGRAKAMEIRKRKNVNLYRTSLGLKLTEERLEMYTQALKNKYKIEFVDLYDKNKRALGTKIIIHIPIA